MDYSPWSEGKFWPFLKGNEKVEISGTEEVMPTKIGLHAIHANPYLHEFFEPILFFDPMDYSPWSERKFWPFLKGNKKVQISETEEPTPTKIGLHVFHANPYLHEFFEPILFFDPHGLYPKGNFGHF